MALHMQGVGTAPPSMNGNHKIGAAHRLHEYLSIDHEEGVSLRLNGFPQGESSSAPGRTGVKRFRGKRFVRAVKNRECPAGFWAAVLISGVSVSLLLSYCLFAVGRSFTGDQAASRSDNFFRRQGYSDDSVSRRREGPHEDSQNNIVAAGFQKRNRADVGTRSKVQFGVEVNGIVGHRDSRDWDSDDRKREPVAGGSRERSSRSRLVRSMDQRLPEKEVPSDSNDINERLGKGHSEQSSQDGKTIIYRNDKGAERKQKAGMVEDLTNESLGLYNENGRQELRKYEEQFEANLRSADAFQAGDSDIDSSDDGQKELGGKIRESKGPPNLRSRKQFR